jgi:prophage regulatory protein
MTTQNSPYKKVLRIWETCDRIGNKRATVYEKITPTSPRYDKTFPRPIKLSGNPKSSAIGFIASEIDDWIQSRIDARDGK